MYYLRGMRYENSCKYMYKVRWADLFQRVIDSVEDHLPLSFYERTINFKGLTVRHQVGDSFSTLYFMIDDQKFGITGKCRPLSVDAWAKHIKDLLPQNEYSESDVQELFISIMVGIDFTTKFKQILHTYYN